MAGIDDQRRRYGKTIKPHAAVVRAGGSHLLEYLLDSSCLVSGRHRRLPALSFPRCCQNGEEARRNSSFGLSRRAVPSHTEQKAGYGRRWMRLRSA